jgi:hypothetical protein
VVSWLRERGLSAPNGMRWRVEIAFDLANRPASFAFAPTRFQIAIDPDVWGFEFVHDGRASTIQVKAIATARDRDEHRLVALTPSLSRIGTLLRILEARYGMFFPRHHAALRSSIPRSQPLIRAWISTL